MPSDDLEQAREQFLDHLAHDGIMLLMQQPLVAYWLSAEAEAKVTDDLRTLEGWSKSLARDKDKVEALKGQAQHLESGPVGSEDLLALVRHILSMLDDAELKINRRLAIVRDRLGRWVFLAGPGVKKKPPPKADDEDKEAKKGGKSKQETKRALIQRPKAKSEPKKLKSL